MTVKQFCFLRSQLEQKPVALSFHVPTSFLSGCARGCRVILPSGVKVIVNLVPDGVAAVKGWPLKNAALMSFGAIGAPANAAPASRTTATVAKNAMRIEPPGRTCARFLRLLYIEMMRLAIHAMLDKRPAPLRR